MGELSLFYCGFWVLSLVFYGFCCKCFLVKFFPRYFIFLEVIVNGIVSLISFSICSFLVYRKDAGFYILILYPITLSNKFMISKKFVVEFLGSFRYSIITSANKDNSTSYFPIWICLFLRLITLSKNFKTILNRSGESGHLYFIPDFSGNGFSCSTFSRMMTIGLSYIVFIILRNIPSILITSVLLSWKDVEFCPRIFLHLVRGSCHFCPCFCLHAILSL
jgi:hypothetical protein